MKTLHLEISLSSTFTFWKHKLKRKKKGPIYIWGSECLHVHARGQEGKSTWARGGVGAASPARDLVPQTRDHNPSQKRELDAKLSHPGAPSINKLLISGYQNPETNCFPLWPRLIPAILEPDPILPIPTRMAFPLDKSREQHSSKHRKGNKAKCFYSKSRKKIKHQWISIHPTSSTTDPTDHSHQAH